MPFTRRYFTILRALFIGCILSVLPAVTAGAEEVDLTYLYNLSDLTGDIPSSWARFAVDPASKEVYVISPADGTVGVFKHSGLLEYTFGADDDLPPVQSLAVGDNGDLYTLSSSGESGLVVNLADYRGSLKKKIVLQGVPPLFATNFLPERIFFRQGKLYLVDRRNYKVGVIDTEGTWLQGYDLRSSFSVDARHQSDYAIIGFDIAPDGSFVFSIPVVGKVYYVSPDGAVQSFGTRGSSPGKFNVIAGIAVDGRGYLYLVDTLRCVIMVFDSRHNFDFKGEFGYRGFGPGNLIAPMDVAVTADQVYVAQSAERGVSVYRINHP